MLRIALAIFTSDGENDEFIASRIERYDIIAVSSKGTYSCGLRELSDGGRPAAGRVFDAASRLGRV